LTLIIAGRASHHRSCLEEAAQLLRARRMAELAERFRLDLADPFPRHREILAHFLERVLAAVGESEPEAEDFFLARCQRVEHLVRLFPWGELDDRLHRRDDLLVLDD